MIETHYLIMSTAHSTKKEDIICALCDIALQCDEDFNGHNGDEYLWDIAKEKGYKNNMDYVADMLKNKNTINDIIVYFFEHWCGIDQYFDSYEYDYTILENEQVVIAFSYVHEN